MWPYFLILFLLILVGGSSLLLPVRKRKEFVVVFSFIILLAFSALRAETVGGDLERYLPEYDVVNSMSFLSVFTDGPNREPGFLLMEKLVGYVFPSHRGFIIFTSLVISLLFFKAIYNNANRAFFSILLMYLVFWGNTFNIIRASMATAIGLNALDSICDRKFFKFLIILLLAACVQKTAVALLPIYFMYGRKIKPLTTLMIIMGVEVLVIGVSGSSFANFVNTYVQVFSLEDTNEYVMDTASLFNPMFLFLFGLTCLGLYGQIITKRKDKMLNFYVLVMAMATCLQAFSSVFTLMNRIAYFYYVFLIFYIPYLVFSVYKKRANQYVILSVLGLLLLYMFVSGLVSDPQEITPYVLL